MKIVYYRQLSIEKKENLSTPLMKETLELEKTFFDEDSDIKEESTLSTSFQEVETDTLSSKLNDADGNFKSVYTGGENEVICRLTAALKDLEASKANEEELIQKLAIVDMERAKLHTSTSELEHKVSDLEKLLEKVDMDVNYKNERVVFLQKQLLEVHNLKVQNEELQNDLEDTVSLEMQEEDCGNEVKCGDSGCNLTAQKNEDLRILEVLLQEKEVEKEMMRISLSSIEAALDKKESALLIAEDHISKLGADSHITIQNNEKLQAENLKLNAMIAKKDEFIKILQDTLASMAAENIADVEMQVNVTMNENITAGFV